MLWKRIYLQNLAKRHNSTKKSKIKRKSDQKNLVKQIEIDCGSESSLRKRKIGDLAEEDEIREKKRVKGITEVYDKNRDVDLISELPEPIIHHIFACLRCTRDVVRTSILSKKWKSMFYSYLMFDFDDKWFRGPRGRGRHNRIKAREIQKKKFKKYVEKSLATRLDPVPCIDKFRLHVNYTYDILGTSMTDWIMAAVNKNVKELDVRVNTKEMLYPLPFPALVSSSITSLKLSGSIYFYLGPPIKLPNLRELSIKDDIRVNEPLIKKFEEGCPLMEDLRLVCCKGLSSLTISSLPKLRRVEVHECAKLNCISIAAPNLESFWYHAKCHQHCKIDLKGSENLKSLTLKDRKMTDRTFQDLISMCPFLEKLVLNECTTLERLTILSGKLKSLALIECLKLQEVNIDAPNLYSFQYNGRRMPFSSMNVMGLREAKFSFSPSPIPTTSQCIVEYQKLFGNFDQSKGFKLIVYCNQSMKIYEEPSEADSFPNYFLKLEITTSLASIRRSVDNWLRECHGNSLTLISPSSELIKLIHPMVMEKEDNLSCCRFYSRKCWRHYIAGVFVLNTTKKTYYTFNWSDGDKSI